MRLHSSLRVRLIAWFVGVAALIVLVVSSLALAVVYQVAVTEARQSLGVAASETPTLIIGYLEKHLDWDGLQPYLLQKLAPLGVVAHVEPRGQPFTALQQMAPYQGFFSKTPSLEWVPYELFRAPAG